MNNQKYWEQRVILKDKLLEKDISKIEKELLKLFKNSKKEVLNELKIIYSDIESTEYQKYRIDSLLTSINNSLDNLYGKSEKEITEGLKDIYKTMYQEASVDLKASFNTINENLIEEVTKTNLGTKLNESRDIFVLHNEVLEKIVDDLIASNWSGLTLVERILEHKRKLSLTLKEELSKGLIRGDSLQDMSRILSKKMDLSYSNALRIVRTESCWIMNEATVNNYKDNGIKEYEFMAFLDSKTSKACKKLNGKKFSIEEYKAGVNLPPLHPNCRSCIIPIEELVEPVKIEDKPKRVAKKSKANTKETKPKTNTKKPKEAKTKLPKFKKPESYKRYYGYQMSELHDEWSKSLSDEQREAIKKYTNQGWYSVVNKKLRSGAKLTDSDTDKILKDLFDNVSSALATNKIPKNMQVYRGSSASIFKDLLSEDLYKQMRSSNADINELKDKLLGTIMKDDAYMSTTIIDDVSFHKSSGFLKNVLFKIDIDKNVTGAGYIAELSEIPLECELLLDKGTKLYIKDITWNESFEAYEISCHYLGQ